MAADSKEKPPVPTYHHSEDASVYRANASFVFSNKYTSAVLNLLDAQPGDTVLDLGCGSGDLTRTLASIVGEQGSVLGIDSSVDMIATARKEAPNLQFDVADGCALSAYLREEGLQGRFDKVFSNAAIHWMRASPMGVIEGVHKALTPGGIFAAEFGGFLNVMGIRGGLHQVLRKRGIDPESVDPWFFPTPETYTTLLASPALQPAFEVLSAELVPRPTPLPTGLRGWLSAFGGPFLNALPPQSHDEAIQELEDLLRPDMYDPIKKEWSAMYVRLRIKARKPATMSAGTLAPAIPLSSTPQTGSSIAIDPSLVEKFMTTSPDSAKSKAAADRIQSDYIDQTVRISIPDGRIFEGTMTCIDDGMNIILSQTNELRTEVSGEETSRFVGMVMIKGVDVVHVGLKVGHSQASSRAARAANSSMDRTATNAGWPTDPAAYA